MKNILFSVMLSLALGSCSQKQSPDEHAQGDVKLMLTAYSANFEVFAEADPFSSGDSSQILAHFTHLSNFKALDSGRVTVRLITGAGAISQTLESPARRGIYIFNIKPENEGTGQLEFELTDASGQADVLRVAVIVYPDNMKATEAAGALILSRTNRVFFTKEQSWKIDFATAAPEYGPFGQVIRTTAQVLPAQGDEVIVVAKTGGIINYSFESIIEGKMVRAGQALFSVSGSGLAGDNSGVRYQEARNNYLSAKSVYERKKELASERIVSEKELRAAQTEYENAKAVFDSYGSNFSAEGQRVASPISGFVKQLFVSNGQYVEAGQGIVSIAKNRTLLIRADLQQRYAPFLSNITSATIRSLHDDRTYSLEELDGKIVSYGKSADAQNFLIPVTLQVENKGALMPGGFVELYLLSPVGKDAVSVPNTALLEEQGNFNVLVQLTPELFEMREVKLGANNGFRTEITAGLSTNDRIITRGAILVKLAQASGTLDAHSGHVH